MTDAEIRAVLDRYEQRLREACVHFAPDHNGECVHCDGWADAHPPPEHLRHLTTMIPKMRAMLDDLRPYADYLAVEWERATPDRIGLIEADAAYGKRREKLMRWLGFMQGVFYDTGIYTIDEMRAHNAGGKVSGSSD